MAPNPQVLIVGAGPGGLASAMLLRHAGVDVKIIERLDRPGGRTSSFTLPGRSAGDEFRFDLGPTFFLYPRVLRDIYRRVGRDFDREVPMTRLDPQYHLVYGAGGEIRATPDIERMKAEVARLAPADAANLERFMSDNRSKLEALRPVLERPFNGWGDLFSKEMLGAAPWAGPLRSVDTELRRYFKDPRVRLAFCFQSKYLGMSPFRCPSLFSILSFLEYEHGVWHPEGGCAAVSEHMASVCEDLGVEFHYEESVEEVLFEGKRAVGLRTDRGTYAADSVVINADFARAMQRLVPNRLRSRWSDQKIAKKKFSCSTFMLYLGIEGHYEDLEHHTIYLAEDYIQNLADIESGHVLSEDPSFYVQNAVRTDPGLAPDGQSTLYVLVPVTHQHENVDWTQESARFRELTLRQLGKIGLHDVEERIVAERCVTPADWDHGFEIHRGATFNLAHGLDQMLHLRPRNRFEDLDSVYLVGGGTHPGSGLPVIYEGAQISAKLLLEDLGIDSGSSDNDRRRVAQPQRQAQPSFMAGAARLAGPGVAL
jgi:phytoene desaturase